MGELTIKNNQCQIQINVNGEWKELSPLQYGEILIKVHDGEVKQIETTTKEKY